MELVNIFLESDCGRVKIEVQNNTNDSECKKSSVVKSTNNFIDIINQYINVEKSTFYLAIKNQDIFIFKYDKGKISQIENEFFTFNSELMFVNNYNKITGIEFIVTDTMSIHIYPKVGLSVISSSNNNKFY
ncbi:putative virion core protein [Sheeppox virus]|uniref:Virion core protein n=2 Tax=Sheeppox virus TaxID=10266 RepID=A0A3F2YKJ9_SHEVT|nr:putative virion core protein [Sheeppox virus]AOE46402.1 virion core protein [Sheeppox virus]AOE46544.1 virion core protein [Sheeppox virus]AVI09537.1 putative virion core protein [Sheeppox virus]AVI09671.1 putative virion core protein [Sheeppox virus]QEJ79640.1 virion core protein [Sheeppox virus]